MLPDNWNKKLIDLNADYLNKKDLKLADYVFLSAMHVWTKSARNIIDMCIKQNNKIVAGGTLFSQYEKFTGLPILS